MRLGAIITTFLGAIIATFVGAILTAEALREQSYLWLIGSIPLLIMGIILFFVQVKQDKKEKSR